MADRITCLGSGNIYLDRIIVREYPEGCEKQRTFIDNLQYEEVGGTCGNVMAILPHLGVSTFPMLRSDLGRESSVIKESLEEYGADTRFVSSEPDGGCYILDCNHRQDKDGRAFGYGVGYHPYLRTSNCFNTWLEGFDGATYESTRDLPCDAAGGNVWRGKLPVWPGCDLFKMPGEGSAVALVDPAWSRRITIRTTGGSDVVTWIQNKSLEHVFNVDRSEINDYVCVEPANFYPDRWPTVPAGGEHAFQTVIAAEPLK